MIPSQAIEQRLQSAVLKAFPEADPAAFAIRPCAEPKHGDYQSSGAMGLAKQLKRNPRQIAQAIVDHLDIADLTLPPAIAGAGFLNFTLRPEALAAALHAALQTDPPLLLSPTTRPQTVVIDYSSPNVAKPMHVGHIRSTVLGDCLARVHRRLGHRAITDNHLGDWGTQFGKLIVGWKSQLDGTALAADPIAEMERLYRQINQASEQDVAVLEAARRELALLQAGDAENRRIWEEMIRLSQAQFDSLYARLDVAFDHQLGESFYNPWLQATVKELRDAGIARESEGAIAVFFDDDPALKDHPAIVRKSDGAANYTTTDLATLVYRLQHFAPDRILYVTDGRQQLHFRQLFSIFRRWHPESRVQLEHVWFGSILGDDGKPFKTRSGDTIRLVDLLDEAETRALAIVTAKNPELPEPQRREIARVIGIGAIKYFDLLPNRQSDYVFSWDRMLALNGNTAPYLQYAYTRIRSIFRRGGDTVAPSSSGPAAQAFAQLDHPDELALARHLLNFDLVLQTVAAESRPNYLCNYLYDLAGRFARFYESCPVLKAEEPHRTARIALCQLCAAALRQGLDSLGIATAEVM